jgi:hypothetical protein
MKPKKLARLIAAEVVRLQSLTTLNTTFGPVVMTPAQNATFYANTNELTFLRFLDEHSVFMRNRTVQQYFDLYMERFH